jgi:hypothetical protein
VRSLDSAAAAELGKVSNVIEMGVFFARLPSGPLHEMIELHTAKMILLNFCIEFYSNCVWGHIRHPIPISCGQTIKTHLHRRVALRLF